MGEGVASAATGQVIADPVYDDPAAEPAPDPQRAPKGWAWDRGTKRWKPRARAAAGAAQQQAAPPAPEPEQRGIVARITGRQRDQQQPPAGTGRDPDPAWMRTGDDAPPPPRPAWDPSEVSGEVKDDIAGMLALFYSIPADFMITVDPYCFGALNENLSATIDATVPIICRSKTAVEFVTGASGLILWVKLLSTLKPFAVAVWQHHIIHAVELVAEQDEETGETTGRVTVHRQDFSAYPAA